MVFWGWVLGARAPDVSEGGRYWDDKKVDTKDKKKNGAQCKRLLNPNNCPPPRFRPTPYVTLPKG
jgi:hypothetical protein